MFVLRCPVPKEPGLHSIGEVRQPHQSQENDPERQRIVPPQAGQVELDWNAISARHQELWRVEPTSWPGNMTLCNFLRHHQLAIGLGFQFFWSVHDLGLFSEDFLFSGHFRCKLVVLCNGLRYRSMADNPSVGTHRHDEVRYRTRHSNVMCLYCLRKGVVAFNLHARTTRITVRSLTRSPAKHLSTIHLDVWTSRAAKTCVSTH
jgi:hypothetical protein